MRTTPNKSEAELARSKPANAKLPAIASASVPDTLSALHVNPEIGLTHAEVDTHRKEHGYNEVAKQRGPPFLKFLSKFWGLSAWMLDLTTVLSAVFGKYSDLAVVGAPLPHTIPELTELAQHCTEREDAATKVERRVSKSAAALLLSGRIGEQFDAVVTGASDKGTWVRLFQPPTEVRLERGFQGLDVGDLVRVKLVHTDVERGFLNFARD